MRHAHDHAFIFGLYRPGLPGFSREDCTQLLKNPLILSTLRRGFGGPPLLQPGRALHCGGNGAGRKYFRYQIVARRV